MGTDRARLLMHPVRMRIVMALSAEALTTRDLQRVLPDVPQASLYRGVADLKDGGVVEVVSEERRGGAIEKTYRVVRDRVTMTREEFTSGPPEEFLATIQVFADQIVAATTAFMGASQNDEWRGGRFSVRHEPLWLTEKQREDLSTELAEVMGKYESMHRRPGSRHYSFNLAIIPDHGDTPEN
nr:helix-turn-helix domain-containing protein [Demequina sediminicola]